MMRSRSMSQWYVMDFRAEPAYCVVREAAQASVRCHG